MKLTVYGIGKRNKGEKSKKSGKPYDGTTLHCVTLNTTKDVEAGQAVKEVYMNHLSPIAFPVINIGDVINVEYDENGWLDGIEVLKPAKT